MRINFDHGKRPFIAEVEVEKISVRRPAGKVPHQRDIGALRLILKGNSAHENGDATVNGTVSINEFEAYEIFAAAIKSSQMDKSKKRICLNVVEELSGYRPTSDLSYRY